MDKLVTLAIHTYQKAQIIKTLLESEGFEVYLHNVNLISPVVSSGVRIRIKESDLPAALKFIEESQIYQEEKPKEKKEEKKILIPIDFSEYSMQACEIGFNYAKEIQAKVIIMHAYYAPEFSAYFPLNETFPNPRIKEDESLLLAKKAKEDLHTFTTHIKEKVQNKEWADVPFKTILREGLPEEEIIAYSKKHKLSLIIMGTRGKNQKDMDLIGSVTAEVIEVSKTPLFAIPENTSFKSFKDVKRIAFGTSFDQKDLLTVDMLFKMFESYDIEFYLFHLTHKQDAWNEIKLAGIKEYFEKQYPTIEIKYQVININDFVLNLERFIRENNIDIISLSTHKRNIFARIFNPSMARKMLFHTDTPLLTLRS